MTSPIRHERSKKKKKTKTDQRVKRRVFACDNNPADPGTKAYTKRRGKLKVYEISPCIEVFIDLFAIERCSLCVLVPSPKERVYRRRADKWHAFSASLPEFGIKPILNASVEQGAMYAVSGHACKQRNRQRHRKDRFTLDHHEAPSTMRCHVAGNDKKNPREDAPEEKANGKCFQHRVHVPVRDD
jgi:hypothetical protein